MPPAPLPRPEPAGAGRRRQPPLCPPLVQVLAEPVHLGPEPVHLRPLLRGGAVEYLLPPLLDLLGRPRPVAGPPADRGRAAAGVGRLPATLLGPVDRLVEILPPLRRGHGEVGVEPLRHLALPGGEQLRPLLRGELPHLLPESLRRRLLLLGRHAPPAGRGQLLSELLHLRQAPAVADLPDHADADQQRQQRDRRE